MARCVYGIQNRRDGQTPEKRYQIAYYAENRDKILAYQKEYRRQHPKPSKPRPELWKLRKLLRAKRREAVNVTA